jgi:Rad3-related DNA helicase
MKYQKFFPHKSIRESQKNAIEFALDSFIRSDKRFVIIEAGTGVGKSAAGLTIARYLNSEFPSVDGFEDGSYFVTTQKILQEQYTDDFGPPKGIMRSIKSSSNYTCSFHKQNTCKESQQLLKTQDRKSRFFKACTMNCKYKNDKQKFIDSAESVTNFPYLMTESTYSGKITPRKLIIIDEAHNIETELSKFIEVNISERFCKHTLKIKWPYVKSQYQAVKWIMDEYYPKVKSKLSHMEKKIEETGIKDRIDEFIQISKQLDMLRSHVKKVGSFLKNYKSQNWVYQSIPSMGRSMRKFSFKPIDVSQYAHNHLFRLGYKVVMMSATILDPDVFCESLGIKKDEMSFISLPTPFPVKNRPILIHPVGSMAAKSIDTTLPTMVKAIKEILSEHKNEKGIIHCHTYKIAKYLKERVKSDRILTHTSENRDAILRKHEKSKKATVLLSPSMAEGVDLKDDLSRFQIIVKIPYPYLGDPLVRKRMNKWSAWYPLQTAKLIVQSAGRSIRSEKDSAVTYILDKDWERFYGKNTSIFPKSFRESIIR